jgi:hypothetical protein
MSAKHLKALDLEFFCDDLDEKMSIRTYFYTLLSTLWNEAEGFSGKRPFGNSGWQYVLRKPLVESKYVAGSIDYGDPEYPEVELKSQDAFDDFVQGMIKELCKPAK